MKNGRSLVDLAQELERQLESKKDLIVPSNLVRHTTDETGDTRLVVEETGGPAHYGVTPLARRQLADKLKIPYAYFERMREDQPELLDRNVNTWLQNEGDRHMLRTLDGNVRAVLSERYRRLDHFDLATAVLPILQRLPAVRVEQLARQAQRSHGVAGGVAAGGIGQDGELRRRNGIEQIGLAGVLADIGTADGDGDDFGPGGVDGRPRFGEILVLAGADQQT